MPSIVDDELSFVSSDSTLVQESPKPCSRCRRVDVLFDINPRTGKKFAQCRGCKTYVNNVSNPKNNPVNNKIALQKDKLAYERVPILDEEIARLESGLNSPENIRLLNQLKQEREELLKGTKHFAESQALLELKRQELELVRQGNAEITPDKSLSEIKNLWLTICSKYPMSQLLIQGSFYLEFARVDRAESEVCAFLTERGGTYVSKSTGQIKKVKKSRPVLLNQDGTIISKSALTQAGFQVMELHTERNHSNVSALEKYAQQSTLHLPLGRRLHRNYCGGAKVPKDTIHMEFGLYVVFNLNGFHPFKLIQ